MTFSFFEPVPLAAQLLFLFSHMCRSVPNSVEREPLDLLSLSAPWCPALAFPPLEGTLVAQGSRESWQALTDATDMVAGPVAVHTERARLAAAMAVEPWWAD